MATPRNPKIVLIAPDRGSFPLDHYGDCKNAQVKYMECLHSSNMDSSQCRPVAKEYLQCRMEHELMDKDDMTRMGYKDLVEEQEKMKGSGDDGGEKVTGPEKVADTEKKK